MGVYGRIVTLSSNGDLVAHMVISKERGGKVRNRITCILDEIQLGKTRSDFGRKRAEQNARRAEGEGLDVPCKIGAMKHKSFVTKNG